MIFLHAKTEYMVLLVCFLPEVYNFAFISVIIFDR